MHIRYMPDALPAEQSISLPTGLALAVSAGLMDAYSFLFRGGVPANAQTGKLLLMGVNLPNGNVFGMLRFACPVSFFGIGLALAFFAEKAIWGSSAVLLLTIWIERATAQANGRTDNTI